MKDIDTLFKSHKLCYPIFTILPEDDNPRSTQYSLVMTQTIYIYTHTYIHTHKFHLEIWKEQRDREIQKPFRNSTGEQKNSLGQEQFT